jgi:hypothetical protein
MKRKKAAMTPEALVSVLAGAVIFVILIQNTGIIRYITEEAFGRASCIIYAASGGGGECTHRISLDYVNLSLQKNDAIKGIDYWYKTNYFSSTAPYFRSNWRESYKDKDPILFEYLIDRVFAKEIRYCKEIGKAYGFRDWWTTQKYERAFKSEEDALTWWQQVGGGRPPVLCFTCSRIKFDKELNDIFSGGEIKSLNEWMSNTPLSKTSRTSYYEDSLFEGYKELATPSYKYTTSEPQAVVYAKITNLGLRWFAKTYPGRKAINILLPSGLEVQPDTDAEVNAIIVMPSGEVSRQCDFPLS